MENSLNNSLNNNEISIFFQPKFCSKTLSVVGFEALSRWLNPTTGLISPVFFIPLAEKTGFICELGDYVIDESCKTLRWLKDNGYQNLSCAINVSIIQLERKKGIPFMLKLKEAMNKYNIDGRFIEVEITESVAISDFKLIEKHIVTLRDLGIVISLDDFGTGESTICRLKKLPFDQLKIDKTFVDDVHLQIGKNAITKVLSIASELELSTVAEGVETEEQAVILTDMGCTYLQGFLLGKPMPREKLLNFLKVVNK